MQYLAAKGIVMNEKNKGHWKWLHVRLTLNDYNKIKSRFGKSTEKKISTWVRKLLLDKPITINHRNQSLDDFLAEMIVLRNDLSAIGNNYNQIVKRLHVLADKNELQSWLLLNETAKKIIAEKIDNIKSKIYSINDKWLQE